MIVLRMKKRLCALLLTIGMSLSLPVLAQASLEPDPVQTSEAWVGGIIVRAPGTTLVAGKTMEAYRILDGSLVNAHDPDQGTNYVVPATLREFYASYYSLDSTSPAFSQEVLKRLEEEKDLRAFAREALAAAKAAKIKPDTAQAASGAQEVKIDQLKLGCYVVTDQEAALPLTMAAVSGEERYPCIVIKTDRPTLKKEIDRSRELNSPARERSDSGNAALGDTIYYRLSSKVPDMTGYQHYFFVIQDTLSAGLKYNHDLQVWVGGQELQQYNQYNVNVEEQTDGSQRMNLVFLRFYQNWKDKSGQEIVVKYSAQLTGDALVGTLGNENAASLTYSRDPSAPHSEGNVPQPGDVVGTTPDSVTRTYTTGIRLVKADRMGKRLGGASFRLEGSGLNTVKIYRNLYTQDNSTGDYWKLKNGAYTTVPPLDATRDQYESTTTRYVRTLDMQEVKGDRGTVYSGETGVDGELYFDGLSAGSYTLTETKAPEGYRLLKDPIRLNISWTPPMTGENTCGWEVRGDATVKNGRVQVVAVNERGGDLPDTGGKGTGSIYLLGGSLTGLALFLLYRRRRLAQ